MNVDAYLKRIKLDKATLLDNVSKPDLAMLSQLQNNHMLRVPFENLDVISKVEITLDVEAYYKKIVENNRGGFCYELNGLFHWLLQKLGYDAWLISATVLIGDGTWTMEGSHAALIVQLDQPYFVDVGFGDSVRAPLPLTGVEHRDVSGTYRVISSGQDLYDLQQRHDDGEWRTRNRFRTTPRQPDHFKEALHFNQTSPESNFTKRELATIATEDGRVTFSDNKLITTRGGEKEERAVQDEEKAAVFQTHFGIELGYGV